MKTAIGLRFKLKLKIMKNNVITFYPGGPHYIVARSFVASLIRKVRNANGNIRYHRKARRVMIGDQHYYLAKIA